MAKNYYKTVTKQSIHLRRGLVKIFLPKSARQKSDNMCNANIFTILEIYLLYKMNAHKAGKDAKSIGGRGKIQESGAAQQSDS
jgi:hypothetical protein